MRLSDGRLGSRWCRRRKTARSRSLLRLSRSRCQSHCRSQASVVNASAHVGIFTRAGVRSEPLLFPHVPTMASSLASSWSIEASLLLTRCSDCRSCRARLLHLTCIVPTQQNGGSKDVTVTTSLRGRLDASRRASGVPCVSDLGLLQLVGRGALGGLELGLHLLSHDRQERWRGVMKWPLPSLCGVTTGPLPLVRLELAATGHDLTLDRALVLWRLSCRVVLSFSSASILSLLLCSSPSLRPFSAISILMRSPRSL